MIQTLFPGSNPERLVKTTSDQAICSPANMPKWVNFAEVLDSSLSTDCETHPEQLFSSAEVQRELMRSMFIQLYSEKLSTLSADAKRARPGSSYLE